MGMRNFGTVGISIQEGSEKMTENYFVLQGIDVYLQCYKSKLSFWNGKQFGQT